MLIINILRVASMFIQVYISGFIYKLLELKLYRALLCPAEIKGKSVTDHQQDT